MNVPRARTQALAGAGAVAAFRSLLHALWMLVTVVPWALVMLIASLWRRGPALYWMAVRWLRWAVGGARVLLGIRVRVQGRENLPVGASSAAVLLVKHQSTFETFLMPTLMPNPLAYVFKRELLRVPFFGWAMGRLDMIHIDRQQGMRAFAKVVEQGRRLLAQGVWVIMFPEGTRTQRGTAGSYKSGGARLAIAAGAPVVPVAVTSARCWPARALIKRAGVVDVSIGPAIPSVGREAAELTREVEAWIEAEMRRLDPAAYPPELDPEAAPVAGPQSASPLRR